MTAYAAEDGYSIEYSSLGIYTFECTVTDADGNTDTDSISVEVLQGL